jgi:Ca-activated chloride channel family protein
LGGGACELVASEHQLDAIVDKVHRQIGTDVVTALRLRADGFPVVRDSQVPARLPDLFAGAPLFVMGRYRASAEQTVNARLTVEGNIAGHAWTQPVAARRSQNQAVASVWARGRIRELEDRFAIGHGDGARLEKEILTTSLRFGVLSRFTAFVAVDRQVVNEGGQVRQVTQTVGMPAGWNEAKDTMSVAGPPAAGALVRGLNFQLAAASRPAPRGASLQRSLGLQLFLLLALPFLLVLAVVKLCWRALRAGFRSLVPGNAGSDNESEQQPTPEVASKDDFRK